MLSSCMHCASISEQDMYTCETGNLRASQNKMWLLIIISARLASESGIRVLESLQLFHLQMIFLGGGGAISLVGSIYIAPTPGSLNRYIKEQFQAACFTSGSVAQLVHAMAKFLLRSNVNNDTRGLCLAVLASEKAQALCTS